MKKPLNYAAWRRQQLDSYQPPTEEWVDNMVAKLRKQRQSEQTREHTPAEAEEWLRNWEEKWWENYEEIKRKSSSTRQTHRNGIETT